MKVEDIKEGMVVEYNSMCLTVHSIERNSKIYFTNGTWLYTKELQKAVGEI